MTTEEVLIKIDVTEISGKLAANTKAINDLKEANKKLADEYKASKGTDTAKLQAIEANKIAIKSLEAESRSYQKEIQNEIKAQQNAIGSVKALEAEVANMTAKYDKMSQAERDSAKGQEFTKSLNEKREAMVKAKEETGRFQESVGNYSAGMQDALKKTGLFGAEAQSAFSKVKGGISDLKGGVTVVKDFFTSFITGATGASTGMKILKGAVAATGVGLLVLAISALVSWITKSVEGSKVLKSAFAAVGAVVDTLVGTLTKVGGLLVDILTGDWKSLKEDIQGVADNFANMGKNAKEAYDIQMKEFALAKEKRKNIVDEAKIGLEIAKARLDAADKTKTHAQRIEALKKSLEGEKALTLEKVKIAQSEYDIVARRIKLAESQGKKASKEDKDRLAELEAAKINAQSEEYMRSRRAVSQLSTLQKDLADETIEANKKAEEDRQQRLKNSYEIEKQLQDALITNTKKGVDQQIEQEKLATARKIEELKKQTDLTKEGLANRNKLIEELQKQSDTKITELRKVALDENINKAYEAELKSIQDKITLAEKGSQELLDLQLKELDKQRMQEIDGKMLTDEQLLAIDKEYLDKKTALKNAKIVSDEQEARKIQENIINQKIADAYGDAEAIAQIQIDSETQKNAQLLALDEEHKAALYATKADYDAAVIASNAAVAQSEQALIDLQNQKLQSQLQATAAFSSSFAAVLGEFSENTAKAAIFEKASAAFNASLNLAEAISAATASSAKGDPYTLAFRIAANVGAVVLAFRQVTKAISAANQPKTPKFETTNTSKALKAENGLVVPGNSYTGDNIPVWTNSQEEVITFDTRKSIASLVANMPKSNGIDYGKLAAAMSTVRPVVSVSEINSVNSRVETLENLSNY